LKILIIAATSREVKKITDKLQLMHRIEPNFNNYKYGKLNIDVLITGHGSVFMVYYLTKAFAVISYDLAINIGMAGSYDYFLEQGFVLNVIQDEFADLGIENANQFYTLSEMELMDENQYPFEQGKLRALETYEIMEVETLIPVKSVTVNTVHGHQESIDRIRRKFNPDIETTEGAAFFFTCMKEQIRCLQIRCVSHYVEISKVENWNIPLTLKNLRNTVISIFDELNLIASGDG
jgi:futalosine hydrolase